MPTSIKPEIPVFAVDNSADVEQYLFVNHPIDFISLTSDAKDEHHSAPPSPKTELKPILRPVSPQQQRVTFAAPAPAHPAAVAPPKMERQSSTASTTSTASDADSEGFLGGGALRHISGSHHLRELAELAELDAQAKAKRQASHAPASAQQQAAAVRKPKADEGWLAMAWWPESMEMMEHEWSDDFYE